MAAKTWCWKCGRDVMMLDEREWLRMEPLLRQNLQAIKDYRAAHNAPLQQALAHPPLAEPALTAYRELTGETETVVGRIRHHRRSLHGPDCATCGKPLRTPRASYCLPCHGARIRAAAGDSAHAEQR